MWQTQKIWTPEKKPDNCEANTKKYKDTIKQPDTYLTNTKDLDTRKQPYFYLGNS